MLATGQQQERSILNRVLSLQKVSIYDLIDFFKKESVDPGTTSAMVYYLAGRNLLKLNLETRDDGEEAIVSPTPFTKPYLRRKKG